jgi:transcription initiation factor TFIID TATA-box-binding protein
MQVVTELRSEIKIVNTVSTADLEQKVNIDSFNEYEHLHSDLDLYRCGYVKDNKMIGRVTIFGSGKMISVGTKSPENSFKELRKSIKILKNHGLIESKKITPQVRNMVAKIDFKQKLDIETLSKSIPKSMYEPEQFAALIHRIITGGVALIFSSGKVVIAGCKNFEELNLAYYHLKQYFS